MLGRWFWWPMNVWNVNSRAARVDHHVDTDDTAEIEVPAAVANGHGNGMANGNGALNGNGSLHRHAYHR